jgi:hypothetical protein
VSGPAVTLGMVDPHTGYRHLVAVEVVAQHRRSGCYPALCGALLDGARLTLPGRETCETCARQARGQPRRLTRARALITKVRGRWRNTGRGRCHDAHRPLPARHMDACAPFNPPVHGLMDACAPSGSAC